MYGVTRMRRKEPKLHPKSSCEVFYTVANIFIQLRGILHVHMCVSATDHGLLDCHGFGEVARFINVAAAEHCDMVGEELKGNDPE